ncbi:hypothetical protein KBC86_04090 [Candidatus Gracilibacteria bacterium]|nr:hypothetical protein [Candidatus Gracilibacteria bacterium]
MYRLFSSIIGFLIAGSLGFLCILPFGYGIAHGSEFLMYVPFIFAFIGFLLVYFIKSTYRPLKYIGFFFVISTAIVWYNFILLPKLDTEKRISEVKSIKPIEISYQAITWSGKNIGITVQAKFTMNPDISHNIDSSSLPHFSFNSWYSRIESHKINGNYLLSGSNLLPQVYYSDNGYCLGKDEYGNISSMSGVIYGNLLYPYFDGACYRGGKCVTSYEIPGTEFSLMVDASLYGELSECKR